MKERRFFTRGICHQIVSEFWPKYMTKNVGNTIDRPQYVPDLPMCDFFLLPQLK